MKTISVFCKYFIEFRTLDLKIKNTFAPYDLPKKFIGIPTAYIFNVYFEYGLQ